MAFVEGGADEVVHARIDDLESLGGALFLVEALGHEDTGVADDVAAGLQEDFEAEILDAWDEFLTVFLDGEGALGLRLGRPPFGGSGIQGVLIDNADATTDGPELDAVLGLEGGDQGNDLFHSLDERVDRGELGADVHLQSAQLDVRELRSGAVVEAFDGAEIHAELVLAFPGGDILVGFRVDVRVHADGSWGNFPKLAGDFVEVAEFLFAFDIEGVDALFEGVDDFLTGFSDACKSAVGGITAGLDDTEKLTAGNDVEARALGGEQAEDGKVGVRLYGKCDLVIHS